MQPQTTTRNWQYEQMRRSLKMAANLIEITPPTDLTTYRDGGTGWTALEVVCHLRDLEEIFLQRACITVEEDFGELTIPDAGQLALELRYNEQPMDRALADWARHREAHLAYLIERSESEWDCEARHPTRGSMSLLDQLALTVWHDNNHLEQMIRILAEKQA